MLPRVASRHIGVCVSLSCILSADEPGSGRHQSRKPTSTKTEAPCPARYALTVELGQRAVRETGREERNPRQVQQGLTSVYVIIEEVQST